MNLPLDICILRVEGYVHCILIGIWQIAPLRKLYLLLHPPAICEHACYMVLLPTMDYVNIFCCFPVERCEYCFVSEVKRFFSVYLNNIIQICAYINDWTVTTLKYLIHIVNFIKSQVYVVVCNLLPFLYIFHNWNKTLEPDCLDQNTASELIIVTFVKVYILSVPQTLHL